MLMPCRSPMRRRRALSSVLLSRSLPARLGSSELDAGPDDGSTARADTRRSLDFRMALAFALNLPVLALARAGFFFATVFIVFLAALRFLAMAMRPLCGWSR